MVTVVSENKLSKKIIWLLLMQKILKLSLFIRYKIKLE
jgi:hypothetical protein